MIPQKLIASVSGTGNLWQTRIIDILPEHICTKISLTEPVNGLVLLISKLGLVVDIARIHFPCRLVQT